MIEALLYMFGNDGAPRKPAAPADAAVNTPAITEAVNAAGGRLDVAVSGRVKFHVFNDTVFFECRPKFLAGPFPTVSSNSAR